MTASLFPISALRRTPPLERPDHSTAGEAHGSGHARQADADLSGLAAPDRSSGRVDRSATSTPVENPSHAARVSDWVEITQELEIRTVGGGVLAQISELHTRAQLFAGNWPRERLLAALRAIHAGEEWRR